jgi:hypothetical protein
MTIKKINFVDVSTYNIIFNKFANKKTLLVMFLLPILFMAVYSPNFFHPANAINSSNSVVDQSQSNSQSNIQSNSNTNDCNNNVSVQSQTNINGKTTTTSKNTCGDNNSFSRSSSSSSDNQNLKGLIVSAEYATNSPVIVNSVYGNWSLSTNDDNTKDFKSLFIVKPLYQPIKSGFNTTSYTLSNFISNSVQQQNSDTTYVGKIDVVQNVHSSDIKQPDETNTFKGKTVSISILGDRVLVINFDKQSNLFDIFKNIPLVGLTTSK